MTRSKWDWPKRQVVARIWKGDTIRPVQKLLRKRIGKDLTANHPDDFAGPKSHALPPHSNFFFAPFWWPVLPMDAAMAILFHGNNERYRHGALSMSAFRAIAVGLRLPDQPRIGTTVAVGRGKRRGGAVGHSFQFPDN
jgi:hypothetical protein